MEEREVEVMRESGFDLMGGENGSRGSQPCE